jgi:hypothetical protein
MARSLFLRKLVVLGWPFTVYWLFAVFVYLRSYPDTSLGYESGVGAVFFLLSLVFGFIFMIPDEIMEKVNSQSTRDQEVLTMFVAALGFALLLDMLLRWLVRKASIPRTSGSRADWMA